MTPECSVIVEAAKNLFDNRLGHRPDNPLWSAPQDFWKKLGEALYGTKEKCSCIPLECEYKAPCPCSCHQPEPSLVEMLDRIDPKPEEKCECNKRQFWGKHCAETCICSCHKTEEKPICKEPCELCKIETDERKKHLTCSVREAFIKGYNEGKPEEKCKWPNESRSEHQSHCKPETKLECEACEDKRTYKCPICKQCPLCCKESCLPEKQECSYGKKRNVKKKGEDGQWVTVEIEQIHCSAREPAKCFCPAACKARDRILQDEIALPEKAGSYGQPIHFFKAEDWPTKEEREWRKALLDELIKGKHVDVKRKDCNYCQSLQDLRSKYC